MPLDTGLYEANEVYRSWVNNPFRFVEPNSLNENKGLRKPQLAALHSTLSHLISFSSEPATVVMPTGTGKTDAIFALILAGIFSRTLVIVPSDALREQTSEKIVALRNLRAMKAVGEKMLSPRVRKIDSKLDLVGISELTDCNVIIATPQALQNFTDAELSALKDLCSHLIVDEAHHVAAETWLRIRKIFSDRPVIQFTATPFREDNQSLQGKIIYNYSLRDAQRDGYFQEIEFHPIREYQPSKADEAIAEKAVELLRLDLADNKNHLMMVRSKSHKRAEKLFDIYKRHSDLSPVLIHSKVADKADVLEAIKNKKHRIIVCVDMLGEGFDLPELKIAAIHDQHRTPAVTLQFIGRMTRVSTELGTAKFVANIANQKMDAQMAALYEESADWSAIIRDVSENKIKREVLREEFSSQFEDDEDGREILSLNPEPNISAIAYHLDAKNWQPECVSEFKGKREELQFSSVSAKKDLVIMVTRAEVVVPWANTAEIANTEWYLYLAYFDKTQKTLFINSSGDEGQAAKFRELVSRNAVKIAGEKTFRTLHELKFIKLQNVGLTRAQKDVRFTMHVGRDINAIIGELENGTAIKSNIFSTGYFNGEKVTAGCSHKGKIWEMNSDSIDHWIRWCNGAAVKLNDSTIDTKDIINNVMRSEQIRDEWPAGLFFADWPDSLFIENESKINLLISGKSYNLLDIRFGQLSKVSKTVMDIQILEAENEGETKILSSIKISLLQDGFQYSCGDVKITVAGEQNLAEYLNENPLRILKQDGSLIFGNYRYYSPAALNIKIPKNLISVWDWGGVSIHRESMGKDKNMDTVQGFTFGKIVDKYEIVFNDDGAGEVADLVAINENNGVIEIDLYHCKYCGVTNGEAKPGGRVTDTYEVSGQSSRSVKWLNSGEALLSRLLDRYANSIEKGFNRLLKGDISRIDILRYKCRDQELKMGFYIVQPAISEKVVSDEQLSVLGTSYTYIKSVSGIDLRVIVSP